MPLAGGAKRDKAVLYCLCCVCAACQASVWCWQVLAWSTNSWWSWLHPCWKVGITWI